MGPSPSTRTFLAFDMSPSFFQHDATNQGLRDAVLLGDGLLADAALSVSRSNVANSGVCKHSVTVCHPWRWVAMSLRPSTFGGAVAVVIRKSAQKEMFRSAAGRIVALVTDSHPFGDRAVSALPCKSMAEHILVETADSSVTEDMPRTCPYPAIATLVHSLPKRIRKEHPMRTPHYDCRIAVFTPPPPVGLAPTPRTTWPFTAFNRALLHDSILTQVTAF